MRIDAHVHFLDPSVFEYRWMPPEPSVLRRAWLPRDLSSVLARNNFDGCVAVQALTDHAEAEWLLRLAEASPFIRGVVAWVDLTSPCLGRRLDELQRHDRFVGVRHPVHDEEDARWLLRLSVLDGLRELERRRVPFDLLIRPQHLPLIPELASRVPSLMMVIDHIAKPPIASGEIEPWVRNIEAAAQIPGIHVKLSGMITEAQRKTRFAAQLEPYVRHVWELFGPERCLFGSDWPVCLQAGSWKEALAAFTQALGPVDKETRAGVMGGNAARFYRLQMK